jgi:tRNA-2-methylthio-N6-dimethylallyladenosine synthase
VDVYARVPKLVSHLHLPVQHGSDRILMAMKRGYTALQYKSTVRKLREIRPDMAMSSDFIIGFPGETEEDFDKLVKLIDDVRFDNSFSFIYSPRPGTPAASLHDETSHDVKLKRLQKVQAMIDKNMLDISQEHVGSTMRILVEGLARKSMTGEVEFAGRTECHRTVNFPVGQDDPTRARLIGQLLDVKITHANPHSLRGELVLA